MRGDEAGIPSCEETRQQQEGHSGTRAFRGRRERGTVGRNYFYFARQPARPRHDHTNKWRVPEALLAMVKGGWREWRPPVGECLARSPGPWSNVPRACCSTGDAARSREWPGRPCALLERDAQPTGPRCGHWMDGRTDRTVDDAGRWTLDEEWHHHAARLPSGRLFGLSVLAGLPFAAILRISGHGATTARATAELCEHWPRSPGSPGTGHWASRAAPRRHPVTGDNSACVP